MKYYSERQVKRLLKEQILDCKIAAELMIEAPMIHLPKGKEGNVYSQRQVDNLRNYDLFQFDRLDFHLD